MKFSIIVAMDGERGIGKNGTIPWHLSADLKHFSEMTTAASAGKQNAVIMGRKTWDSLPEKYRPLPRRLNVVVSRKQDFNAPAGVLIADSLDSAFAVLQTRNDVENIFIIGGAQLIAEAIRRPECEKIYLTELDQSFDCDVFLADIPKNFELQEKSKWLKEGEIGYRFIIMKHVT